MQHRLLLLSLRALLCKHFAHDFRAAAKANAKLLINVRLVLQSQMRLEVALCIGCVYTIWALEGAFPCVTPNVRFHFPQIWESFATKHTVEFFLTVNRVLL